jgi:uncharacterized damage-inducible protein DinB
MTRLAHFQSLQRYETWASARSLAALRTCPETDHAARARGIFAHIQSARHVWLFRLGHIAKRPWVMFPEWTVDQCEADATRLDQAWAAYLETLADADLDEPVHYHSNDGHPFTSLRCDILTHVYNHSTYHRGQIALLVRLAGGTPTDTDFIIHTRQPG